MLLFMFPLGWPGCGSSTKSNPSDAGIAPDAGSGGNGSGGSSATSACNPECTGTKPACNAATKTCVECTADGNCTGTKPACNTTTNACVQCTQDSNCPSGKPLCDTSTNVCVQCKSNADCPEATASLCNAGTCSPCATDTDCSHISGKSVCKTTASGDAGAGTGVCVQCTVSNESACGQKSCDPATNGCTGTRRDSVDVCYSCKADSECINADGDGGTPTARCVPMRFGSANQVHGNYCLQSLGMSTACPKPYTVVYSVQSTSGAAAEQYCGINQDLTTCKAVLEFGSTTCSTDANCGQGQGGLCKAITGIGTACTIPCGDPTQCPRGRMCSSTVNGYCQ